MAERVTVAASLMACLLFSPFAHTAVSFTGSLKNLSVGTRSSIDGKSYGSNLTRLRLEPGLRRRDWNVAVVYDLEALTGSFLESPEFTVLREAPDPRYWDLQSEVHGSGNLAVGQQLYRATVQWRSPVGDLRLGRQQINWSTAWIWNPMDILNPVSPLQLEPEERIGVDALLWDKAWGAVGRISAVYAPQHDPDEASKAVRVRRYIAGVDVSLMAGEFAGVDKVGLSGSGSVGGIGWRSEVVWSDSHETNSYWQAVADLNWSFQSGVNLALEYFYNGLPVPLDQQDPGRLVVTEALYASRHYAGLLVWQAVTPFWQYRVIVIRNADDGSGVLYPRTTWMLPMAQEVYLTAGVQLFDGGNRSEYGQLDPLGLLEAHWFF